MYRISFIFICLISFHANVFAEISSSSCAVLRTATSLTNIVPEFVQLAMRFYYAPLTTNSTVHHRQKRFFASSGSSSLSASVAEQTLANTVKDVNFTNVALLILKNNETMNKIRKNIDNDAILRFILREINYEKLFSGLWSAIEENFDLEHFLVSVINRTHVDVIHEDFFVRGTLPTWFVKTLNPNWNVQIIEQISSTIRKLTEKFVKVLSKSERFDNYLFNMIIQQAITPLNNIIQGVKQDKPNTFDQLIQIIVNRVAMEQINANTDQSLKKKKKKIDKKLISKSQIEPVDLNNNEDVKLMLYQWSIAVDSIGQTTRVILKSLDQLYCIGL